MRRSIARHLVVVATVSFGGCGFKNAGSAPTGSGGAHVDAAAGAGGIDASRGGSGGGGGGGSAGTTNVPVIITADGGGDRPSSSPDLNCGARSKAASKVAPDILILLDRSSSMNDDVNNQMCRPDGGFGGQVTGCGATSKWAQVVPAITQVVRETEGDVNWGLKFFPDNATACAVNSSAAVPVAARNADAIAAAIQAATSTNGGVMGFNGTPTRAASAGATSYLTTLTDSGPKYVLLATDGLPNCPVDGGTSADDALGAAAAVGAAKAAGFPTFVVGIATGGGAADTTLSNMANAGGLPRAGMPTYYPVTNATDLATAIRTLVGVAATCTFQIGPAPTDDGTTDLGLIDVFGDGTAITRDTTHTNGYDYTDDSKQSIQVHGPLCDQIMSGYIHEVTVTFRCVVT